MKKRVILISVVLILIMLVPLYESYSYKKEATQKAEQLEKEFIDEFYVKATKDYYPYKDVIESQKLLDSKDYRPYSSASKLHQIIQKYIQLENNYGKKVPNIEKIQKYYFIACDADNIYLDAVISTMDSKTSSQDISIDFAKLQKYIDTVDEVIEKYNLDPKL